MLYINLEELQLKSSTDRLVEWARRQEERIRASVNNKSIEVEDIIESRDKKYGLLKVWIQNINCIIINMFQTTHI